MKSVRFYRDHDDCSPRVDVPADEGLLQTFLEDDAHDTGVVSELIRELDKVSDGKDSEYEITGNAHQLRASGSTVRIESLVDDSGDSLEQDLDSFLRLLASWQSFLEDNSLLGLWVRI